jgi:hypothetical protein
MRYLLELEYIFSIRATFVFFMQFITNIRKKKWVGKFRLREQMPEAGKNQFPSVQTPEAVSPLPLGSMDVLSGGRNFGPTTHNGPDENCPVREIYTAPRTPNSKNLFDYISLYIIFNTQTFV